GAGDLPLVGGLFRYNTNNRTKTNLMVFLRPRIIRDADSGTEVTADRYAASFEGQRSFNKKEEVEDGPQLKLAPFMDEAKRE
ncbi:MAG TPA: type II secretion system protein GspD, partial [Rhodocyclaceae bacterium]|nr:type II secretion system protein GspD [Rhodocyclaceae bacterium]